MSTCKILQLQVKVYNKFTFFVLYYSAYLCNRIWSRNATDIAKLSHLGV